MNLVKAILSKDPKAAKLAFEARMRPFVAHVMSNLYTEEAKSYIMEEDHDEDYWHKQSLPGGKYGTQPPTEIDAERYNDMLNVLPPSKWTRRSGAQSFHVSERLSGDIVSWFIQIGNSSLGGRVRYFTLQNSCYLNHDAVVKMVLDKFYSGINESLSDADKKLVAQYRNNEEDNYHSENALLLAKRFGTGSEANFIAAVLDRLDKDARNGNLRSVSDNRDEYDKINAIHMKYSPEINKLRAGLLEAAYTPLTGAKCSCRPGVQRDNCPNCEGTGKAIDFRAIHARREASKDCCTPTSTGHHAEDCKHWLGEDLFKESEAAQYILWALPKGKTDRLYERPLTSMPITKVQIERVKTAASADGWHGFRTTLEDGSVPNFGAAVKESIDLFKESKEPFAQGYTDGMHGHTKRSVKTEYSEGYDLARKEVNPKTKLHEGKWSSEAVSRVRGIRSKRKKVMSLFSKAAKMHLGEANSESYKKFVIKNIIAKAFPDYKGRKVSVGVCDSDFEINDNYWQEGYRGYYALVDPQSSVPAKIIPTANPFANPNQRITIPSNMVIVRRQMSGSRPDSIQVLAPKGSPLVVELGAVDTSVARFVGEENLGEDRCPICKGTGKTPSGRRCTRCVARHKENWTVKEAVTNVYGGKRCAYCGSPDVKHSYGSMNGNKYCSANCAHNNSFDDKDTFYGGVITLSAVAGDKLQNEAVTISRDPFARQDTVREKAQGECSWCGQPAKFRYGTHADGINTRPNMQKKVFCSKSCERDYNS